MIESSPSASSSSQARSTFGRFSLLLAVLIVLVYYPALFAKFNWDDLNIIGHEYMRSLKGLATIWFSPSQSICNDYWPLDYTSHWIEYQLWGMNPTGYHAVNMALHWVNACVLLYLLRRMAVRGALLVAVLFAIHPMQVSSVAWAVERKDLLNAFFYLLTFLAWMRFEEDRSLKRYLVVFIFFAASLLSKSMSITWPAAALVYCWWHAGRIEWRRVLPLLPLLVFGFIWVFAFKPSPTAGRLLTPELTHAITFSLPQKWILSGHNFVFYAGKILWPLEHFPLYPRWEINPQQATQHLRSVGTVIVFVLLWTFRSRIGRGPFAAVAFYAITLSPILGLVSWDLLFKTYVQDHYQYLACVGPFLLIAYGFDTFAPRLFRKSWIAYSAIMVVLLLPLVCIAHYHVRLYHDSESLFEKSYARYPEIKENVLFYASGLQSNGKNPEALAVIDRFLALKPSVPEAWAFRGGILVSMDKNAEASAAYKRALSLYPGGYFDIDVLNNYVAALLNSASAPDWAPVLSLLQDALSRPSKNALRTEGNLAIVLSLTGRQAEAERHFENVIRLQLAQAPSDVLYYYGKLCLEKGNPLKALPFLKQAQQNAPKPFPPRYQEAILQAEAAIANITTQK